MPQRWHRYLPVKEHIDTDWIYENLNIKWWSVLSILILSIALIWIYPHNNFAVAFVILSTILFYIIDILMLTNKNRGIVSILITLFLFPLLPIFLHRIEIPYYNKYDKHDWDWK